MGADVDASGRMAVGMWCAAPAQSTGQGSSVGAVSRSTMLGAWLLEVLHNAGEGQVQCRVAALGCLHNHVLLSASGDAALVYHGVQRRCRCGQQDGGGHMVYCSCTVHWSRIISGGGESWHHAQCMAS